MNISTVASVSNKVPSFFFIYIYICKEVIRLYIVLSLYQNALTILKLNQKSGIQQATN
jgi:hypothetical protein